MVEWNEPMMPSKEPVETRRGGFGSVVLEKVVPSALGGSAEYELTAKRIVYRLKFPSVDSVDAA